MKDERRNELQEQYEEAVVSLLMDQYAEEEGRRLLLEFEEAGRNGELPEIPAALDEKCRQLIKSSFAGQRRKAQIRRVSKMLATAAVFVFVFLGLATTLVLSVDALRIPVMNFILQCEERYSSLILGEEDNIVQLQENILERVKSAPIPLDYELTVESIEENGSIFLCYQDNTSGMISFTAYWSDSILNYDTENNDQTEMTIFDHSAIFVNKDGYRIMWLNAGQGMVYELYANILDEAVFWEIAFVLAE